ncbi:MAG: hypothetical protein JKY81_02360 [Colwellia sp.]|nr:hypothetical protein [Colwellia sp.]
MAKKGEFKKGATADSVRQRKFNSKPAQKKRRATRNAARKTMEKKGAVKKGDGKDVDHKNKGKANGKLSNGKGNLRVKSKSANRADNRGTGGRKKGSTTKKKK